MSKLWKLSDRNKNKIADSIKIGLGTKDGKLVFHEFKKGKVPMIEINKLTPPSTEQNTEDLEDKRRKKIGWEFLKYKPKKSNRRLKTRRKKESQKPQVRLIYLFNTYLYIFI